MSELSPDYFNRPLAEVDPEIAEVLRGELEREQSTLEMIASENFVPRAVLECQGSVLTNKYAEGYPGRRYYGGCEWVDVSEQLAIDRAKALFGAEHANVQPHSGSQANAAVYHALLAPGDTIMGLSLAHGGHLTHGMKINVSGRLYDIAAYEVDRESGLIDMDEVARIARERRPKLLLAGWSAYPRQLDFARFREIADEVGALLMVDMAHFAGLVAAGLHPNPIEYGADVVTTTTHKTLGGPRAGVILCKEQYAKKIDSAVFPGQQGGPLEHVIAAKAVAFKIAASELFAERQRRTVEGARALARQLLIRARRPRRQRAHRRHRRAPDPRRPARAQPALTGREAEDRLHEIEITVNRNAVPFDPRPPIEASGLRIGTPALATRGLQQEDFEEIGRILAIALTPEYESRADELAERVGAIVERYPLYESQPAGTPRHRAGVGRGARRPPGLRCCARADGASNRARRALRLPGRRGRDRAADAAHDALREGRRRDRRAARAGPVRASHAAARRTGDLRRGARRRPDLAARRLRKAASALARRAARRRGDHARGRARRPLRPAPGRQAARPGAGGRDRRALRRGREGDHAAVRRPASLPQRGRHERRPGADGDRPGGDDERRQLLRRRRRPGGGRVRDHRRRDGGDRLRPGPPAAGGAGGADRRRGARLPDLQLPAGVELHGRLRREPARPADGRASRSRRPSRRRPWCPSCCR